MLDPPGLQPVLHPLPPGWDPKWRLTYQSLEAVGHGVTQVRLAAKVRPVSVEHEAIQLQFLQETEHTLVTDASLTGSGTLPILCIFKGIRRESV